MNADRLAQDLLGRGVGRRHEPQPGAGPIHGPLEAVELLRNAEVEQLHAPIRLDQDVRGLQVAMDDRSEEHTSELQSLAYLVCRLLLEKKKNQHNEILSIQV